MGMDGSTFVILNGGAFAGVGGATVPVVAGNICRVEAENSGTSAILRSKVNGVTVNENTILAASFPIPKGFLGLIVFAIAGVVPTNSIQIWDNFSCGTF
jgi:hypothetical protein